MPDTRTRLTRKLLALLLLPTVVCLLGFGVLTASDRKRELLAEADRELSDHVAALRSTLPPLAAALDGPTLVSISEAVARGQRVHGIAVYDPQCRPLARSEAFASAPQSVDAAACNGGEVRRIARVGAEDVLLHVARVEGSPRVGALVVGYDLTDMEGMIREGNVRLAEATLMLLGVLAVVALVLARGIGQPLGALVYGAEQVAAGNLDVTLEPRGMLGTERATRGFNEMTDALRAARRELEAGAAERAALERKIGHAQTLAAVGHVAASLAHDVGSPLSTILIAARSAAEDERMPEPARKQFEVIAAQCDRITRIVRQMLSLARPSDEAERPVDVGEVTREVLAFLQPECRRRKVVARIEEAGPLPAVRASRDRLVQVVMNLCVNALQAQPGGGTLVVRVAPGTDPVHGGPGVALEVRDAGPGVPAEARGKVFDAFYSTKPAGEGTGLGLAIVAGVVKDLAGRIEVLSAPEGGACFRAFLPSLEGVDGGL